MSFYCKIELIYMPNQTYKMISVKLQEDFAVEISKIYWSIKFAEFVDRKTVKT